MVFVAEGQRALGPGWVAEEEEERVSILIELYPTKVLIPLISVGVKD